MKSTFFALAIGVLIASCQSKSDSQAVREIIADTSMSSTYSNDISSDTGAVFTPQAEPVTQAALPVKTVKASPTPKAKVVASPAPAETKKEPVATSTSTANETAATTTETADTETATTEEKKGWSNAAKGAVIGAGAGAVGGAVLSKKKGKGALIGGVIGAGAGYIIGKDKDKRKDTSTAK